MPSVAKFKSAARVMAEDQRKAEAQTPLLPATLGAALSTHIRAAWNDAWMAKKQPGASQKSVQSRLLDCARRRKGEYSPEKLAAIRENEGSDAYIPAVNLKCTAAHDFILDIFASNKRPWNIEPTPIPALPIELEAETVRRVQQEILASQAELSETDILALDERARKEVLDALKETAKERAEAMALVIEDALVEGQWADTLSEVVDDLVTYPFCVMKGPVMRMKDDQAWEPSPDGNGKWVVAPRLVKDWERVSPFDFYWQRNIRSVDDGYTLEHLRLNRRKLTEMIDLAGYSKDEIKMVLAEAASGSLRSNWIYADESEANEAEDRTFMDSPEGRIDGLEFWGSVPGQWLLDWGMPPSKIPDPGKEYQITAILIGNHVIRAVLNPHILGRKPYYTACWKDVAGSICGQALPEIVGDIEDAMNATIRALIDNVAMASGPQMGVDDAMLQVGDSYTTLRPWQIHHLDSSQQMGGMGSSTKLPIEFFQPTMQSEALLRVVSAFTQFMDEYTGIPAYTHGVANESGAGATSSGLAMLMTAAGKIIKNITAKVDKNFVEGPVSRLFEYEMQYNPDPSIKGDAKIRATGSGALVAKEQSLIRMRELWSASQNEVVLAVIGLEGFAELTRKVFHQYELDLDRIIPSREVLQQKEKQRQAMVQAKNMPQTANLTQPNAQTLDVAGQPVSGQDNALFVPSPQPQGADE